MNTSENFGKYSLEQIAGQRLMVGFEGTKLSKELMFLIDTIKIGGVHTVSRQSWDERTG